MWRVAPRPTAAVQSQPLNASNAAVAAAPIDSAWTLTMWPPPPTSMMVIEELQSGRRR